MRKIFKLFMSANTLTIPLISVSCSQHIQDDTIISFDASYEDIDATLINSRLNIDKFNDKELLVIIYDVNGEDIEQYGFINKETITIPGQETQVDLIAWVEYIIRQTPSGLKSGESYA